MPLSHVPATCSASEPHPHVRRSGFRGVDSLLWDTQRAMQRSHSSSPRHPPAPSSAGLPTSLGWLLAVAQLPADVLQPPLQLLLFLLSQLLLRLGRLLLPARGCGRARHCGCGRAGGRAAQPPRADAQPPKAVPLPTWMEPLPQAKLRNYHRTPEVGLTAPCCRSQ